MRFAVTGLAAQPRAARAGSGIYAQTPLYYAARRGDVEIAKLLLAAGADVNARTKELDNTALSVARDGNMIALLLAHGAHR